MGYVEIAHLVSRISQSPIRNLTTTILVAYNRNEFYMSSKADVAFRFFHPLNFHLLTPFPCAPYPVIHIQLIHMQLLISPSWIPLAPFPSQTLFHSFFISTIFLPNQPLACPLCLRILSCLLSETGRLLQLLEHSHRATSWLCSTSARDRGEQIIH